MYSPINSTSCSPIHSPGYVALKTAKTITDIAVFKTPIGPAKRSKTKVLDEETYVEKVGEIIERDFFPDLEKLKAQNEYIEALESNNTKKMRELFEKYSFEQPITERLASPATFETPIRKDISNEKTLRSIKSVKIKSEEKELKLKESEVSLDEFLCNTTSEDNASFEEILIENEKKHRLKYAWLYKTEAESKLLGIRNEKHELFHTKNDSKKKRFQIDTWGYTNKNYIMYIPDGVELTSEEKIEIAKKRQEVIHSNTRLKINPFNEQQNKETINELAKIQSKANDGKIGVDGKEIIRNETPRVNGYTFVATPSPISNEIIDSPIMTWGQIEGTPFRLDGGDTPMLHATHGPSFRMAEPPKREKIALQLAEKAGERNRDKKIKALNAARRSLATPSPRSTMDRLSTMSPAARRLATQKLRISVTPSPIRSSKTVSMEIRIPTPSRITTCIKPNGMNSCLQPQAPILTDNLLNLPQRQRASDFFHTIF